MHVFPYLAYRKIIEHLTLLGKKGKSIPTHRLGHLPRLGHETQGASAVAPTPFQGVAPRPGEAPFAGMCPLEHLLELMVYLDPRSQI